MAKFGALGSLLKSLLSFISPIPAMIMIAMCCDLAQNCSALLFH